MKSYSRTESRPDRHRVAWKSVVALFPAVAIGVFATPLNAAEQQGPPPAVMQGRPPEFAGSKLAPHPSKLIPKAAKDIPLEKIKLPSTR